MKIQQNLSTQSPESNSKSSLGALPNLKRHTKNKALGKQVSLQNMQSLFKTHTDFTIAANNTLENEYSSLDNHNLS
jgi:hypothetical protein